MKTLNNLKEKDQVTIIFNSNYPEPSICTLEVISFKKWDALKDNKGKCGKNWLLIESDLFAVINNTKVLEDSMGIKLNHKAICNITLLEIERHKKNSITALFKKFILLFINLFRRIFYYILNL